jgi:fibronectin-binding autotransporter adhesin
MPRRLAALCRRFGARPEVALTLKSSRQRRQRRVLFEPLEQRAMLATLTWVGDVDANWNTNSVGNTNWDTNTLPADGDTLIFSGVTNLTQNNDTLAGNSYTLQFNASGFVINGNSIALDNSGFDIVVANDIGSNNINTPFTMVVDTTIDVGVNSTLVTGGIMSGGGGLRKEGAGTLNLNALSTYSGLNVIAAGIAICSMTNTGAGGFGAFNAAVNKITVLSGATVDMNGSAKGSVPGIDFVYGLTIAGSGTAGQGAFINNGIDGGAGNRSAAFIALSADATIGGTGHIRMINGGHGADTLTLNGFTLSKVGSNTFFLDNTTVTAGTIHVKGGGLSQMGGANNLSAAHLILDNTAGANFTLATQSATVASLSGGGALGGNIVLGALTLTVNQATTTTYNGAISGTGGVVKTGSGSLTLGGTSNYGGPTTLSNGILRTTSATGFGTSTVTLGDANTLANNIQLGLVASITNPIVVSASGTGTVTLLGEAQYNSHTGTLTLNRSAILQVPATGTGSDWWYAWNGVVSGPGGVIIKGGSGGTSGADAGNRVILGNTNTYTGGTVIELGKLQTGVSGAMSTGIVTFGNAATGTAVTQLRVGANVPNNISISAAAPSSPSAIGTYIATPLFTGTLDISHPLTITGGSDRLTWTGGTAVWSGTADVTIAANRVTHDTVANTWTGNLTINAGGTFQPGNANTLSPSTTVTANGTLQLNNVSTTINALNGAATGIVQNIISGNTLTIGGTNGSGTFAGIMRNNSGTLTVVKTGTGTQTLSGANIYTGATTISQGSLILGDGGTTGSLATSSVTLGDVNTGANPVAFLVNRSDASTHANPIVVSALGTGTATIGSTGTAAGPFSTNFSGTVTLNRATTMQGTDPDLTKFSGVISGNVGTLTVTGGARTTWEASNTFVGNVVVTTAGTILQVGPAGDQIPDASNVDLGAGTFLRLNNDGEAINSLTGSGTIDNIVGANTLTIGSNNGGGTFSGTLQNGSGALSIIKAGTGTQTLTGAVGAFTGSVAINGGTLTLNRAGAAFDSGYFPSTTTLTVNTGAILNVANSWNIGSANNVQILGGTLNLTSGAANDSVNYMNNLTLNGGTVMGNPFRVGNSSNGTFLVTGSTASTISASLLLVNDVDVTGVRTLTVNVADTVAGAATDLTMSGIIRDLGQNGTGPLRQGTQFIKIGNGTLALTTANTYTGITTVSAGVLDISNGSALGTGATVIVGGGTIDLRNNITVPNVLTLNQSLANGTLRNAAGDNIWSGPITIPTNSQSIINVAAGTLTVSGALTSNGYGNKTGSGTLILTGANGGSGWMDVSAGLVSLRSNTAAVGTYFHVNNPAAILELSGGVSIPAGETVYVSGVPANLIPTFRGVNGANTFGGTLILHVAVGNRNIGADAGSSLTLTGAINGVDRNFIKVGGGTVTIAGTGNYSGATSVVEGTLVLQNGNAILNTGGAVSVAIGGTLQLLNNETISSFNGAGDGVGTNDSTLALGGNTLTTTGAVAIANVTTTAGGGIVAGTSITDADDDNNITGANVFLQATAGIGTAVDPIETAVGAIQLNNTTSGAVNIANSNAAILLTVSDLRSLGYAARNLGGLLSVTTVGPLTIATTVTAAAALTLSAGDTAASGDNLTVNSPAMIQSTGSTVTLNGGDTVTVPTLSFLAAAGTVTINVDAGSADTATGGVVTLTADIDAPLAVINGGTDAIGDAFTVRPDQDTGDILTPIQVNGLAPTATMTGDTLTLVLTGLGIPTLTLTPGDGNGAFSFGAGAASLVYNSIEKIVTSPALPYHLVVDMQYLGFANGAADTILAQISPSGTDLLLAVNAAPLFTGTNSSIQSLTIIGSSDDETLTIQETTGGLPLFLGGAPVVNNTGLGGGTSAGSHLNASADLMLETILPGQTPWDSADVSFHFAAGGGTDSLQLNLTSANNVGYFSDTIGGGNSGNLLTAPGTFPALGAPTMFMSFDNIEPVTLSGAGGTLLTDASGTPALSTITLTDIGTQTQLVADVGLPTTTLSGFAGLAVVSGDGAESIDLQSVNASSLIAVQIIAGNTNNLLGLAGGDTAADTLRLQSLPATTTATLQGGGGSDLFQLYNTLNTVDLILGTVIIDGTDGSLANNTDTLTIIDTGDTTADDVLIAPVNVATSQDYSIDGITTATNSDVIFRNIDVLNYTATTGNDRIDSRFANTVPSHDLSTVNLSGWTGADQFLLFTSDQIGGTGPNVTPTGVTSGLAMINLYGDALGNPNATDGIDTFGENPPLIVGTGAANVGQVVSSAIRGIRPSVTTGIFIDGGVPVSVAAPQGDLVGDVLNLDISAISNAAPVIVSSNSPGTLAVAGVQPINWTEIEDMNLIDQAKLTNVQMGDLFGRATPGNDLVQFMNGSSNANPNGVRMRVNNTVGDYRASNKTVMYTGNSNDYITQANLNLPAEFYGEGGDDYISGAMGNDWLSGGLGHDNINGSGGDNVIWGDNAPTLPSDPTPQDDVVGGNDVLSGLGGNDVFYSGGGDDQVSAGGGNDFVHGGQGNDTLDGSDGDDRVYGGLGNDVIAGASGHDLLSGGGNDDKLYGNAGNDVIIGGSGADLLDGGSGADLLITGSLPNETSSWTSVASTTTYNPVTYFNPAASDAALLTLLAQWSLSNDNSGALGIQHDGANDDVFGGTGDDDFCWESADTLDSPPFFQLPDFNATGMGTDERFGPQ